MASLTPGSSRFGDDSVQFLLGSRIASGGFGHVHHGINVATREQVAVKIERHAKMVLNQVMYESRLYKILAGGSPSSSNPVDFVAEGIAKVHWYGYVGNSYVMVTDLLGPSLEDLLERCGGRFQLKTVLMLANQLISRLEFMHSKKFLHRDIKPANFLMGLGDHANVCYLIDFGLAKRFIDSRTNAHIKYHDKAGHIGTQRFASKNASKGMEQSRRDDMESLGYVLLYCLRGSLPWQIAEKNEQAALKMKINTSVESLCQGCPDEFRAYFEHVGALRFEDKPDYDLLRGLFSDLFTRSGFQSDGIFDWSVPTTETMKLAQESDVVAPPTTLADCNALGGINSLAMSGASDAVKSEGAKRGIPAKSFPSRDLDFDEDAPPKRQCIRHETIESNVSMTR